MTRFNPIPTPSITASKHAHPIAEFLAALTPPRTANAPPVKKPEITIHPHQQPPPPHPNKKREKRKRKRKERKHTSIIRILLLPHALDRTVERRKQTPPDAEIAAEDWRAGLDRGQGAYAAFAGRRVLEALDAVPDCAADGLVRGGGTKKISSNGMTYIFRRGGGREVGE